MQHRGLKNVQCRDDGKQTKKRASIWKVIKFIEETYSRDQIDQMRMEWAECIQHEI
ncbi:hypothetical protein ACS0TY_034171 [Phlomoides rotata]